MDTSDKSGITDRVSRCRVGGGINFGFNRAVPIAGINNFVVMPWLCREITDGRGMGGSRSRSSETLRDFERREYIFRTESR